MKPELSGDRSAGLLSAMARALEDADRCGADLHHEGGAGFGRVSRRRPAPPPGLAWNHDRTRLLVLDGEVYDRAAIEQRLPDAEAAETLGPAELLLCLYERCGTDGLALVNGAFTLAVWETTARRLILMNDRLGQMPVYYGRVRNGVIFAGGVRALLADPDVDRAVDALAINQFLVFDHALDDRTLLQSVRLLPPGSILTAGDGQFSIHSFWTPRYPEHYEDRSETELVDEFMALLRQAAARQRPHAGSATIMLSGGLDSRLLAAVLCERGTGVETFTFGIPGCDDARVAAAVARTLGTRHAFVELESDWLARLANRAVRLTDGLANIVNLHALAAVTRHDRETDVIYKGVMGDALLGFALKRRMWAGYAPETGHAVHLAVHDEQGVANYDAEQQRHLFTDEFRAAVGDGMRRSYQDGMDRAGVSHLAGQRLFFDLTQRVPRMTIHGVEVARSRAPVRLPFCDNDLVDFALTVPPGYLFERYLPTAAVIRCFPALAKIPIAGSGRPLVSCARDVWVQARGLVAWHLRARGLGWLAGRERRPYKDYDTWFRTVLRSWVEEILLDRRTLDRAYFRPAYVQQLVAEQMAGANHAVRLGALLTLELWHRQFLD